MIGIESTILMPRFSRQKVDYNPGANKQFHLSAIVWPVHSTHRAAVLVPLAGSSPLPGTP